MRTLTATLALLLAITPSIAQITHVRVTLGSYHFNRSGVWNEVNPGVEVELGGRWRFGAYENSFSRIPRPKGVPGMRPTRLTAYAGRYWEWRPISRIGLGVMVGVTVGNDTPWGIYVPLPGVAPEVSVDVGPVTVHVNVLGSAVGASISYSFTQN